MAWDRLRLMVALIVVAFTALVFLATRLDPNRAPSDRRWARWRWSGSKKKAALVLGAFVSVGLVVLLNRLDGGGTPDRRVTIERVMCTDEQGRSVPPPWAGLKGEGKFIGKSVGDKTIFEDRTGNEISCPSPRIGR